MLNFINIFDFSLFIYAYQKAGLYSLILLVSARVYTVILILVIIFYFCKTLLHLLLYK